MLDTETKRRIDTARDILVGKVPDPKSQVEQITIALIYKFMDDMDADAEEMGGKRKFFAGKYARYGWSKLMQPGLGGHEMLNLYAEGIQKMPENPGIPPLFREIFKNAFLPYRDPETLKAFLKVINEFQYDHSERLGDAFEYLLSVLGSQGDAGQFRTPRHIIDFIVDIVDPKKTDTVLDPACGTAGFLISSYKHILKANTDAKGHCKLTPDERARLAANFKGYDISPDMVQLSLVNLYLHGFTDPHIYEYDTLTSLDHWNEHADVILANPPFMSPKGGIKPHNRFGVQSKRSEVLFVDYIAEHLTPNGRAGVIVPEGIIFQSQNAYARLRKLLVGDYLVGVISLPSGVFMPYTGVKTSVLILDRVEARRNSKIMFSEVRDIGFSLGVKRTPTDQNDLPPVLSDFRAYYSGGELSHRSWLVSRESVLAGDANLSGNRYKPVAVEASERFVSLGKVCRITKGSFSSTKTPAGPYRLVVTAAESRSADDFDVEGPAVCIPLISSLGHGKAALHRIHYAEGRFALANLLVALQPKNAEELDARFLYLALDARRDAIARLMQGAANVSMKPEDLERFEIPLPPLSAQREIAAEIEGYQKVIDGARAVIDNYRPHIPIDPAWPVSSLDVLAENLDSRRVPITKGDRKNGPFPYYGASGIVDHVADFIFDEDLLLVSEDGANLLARSTPIAFSISGKSWVNNHAHVLRFREAATQKFAEIYLNSVAIDEFVTGAAQPKLTQQALNTIPVPIPDDVDVQRAIVAEVEAEQALVSANRELIARMEKKIQATLARVWGEEPKSAEDKSREAA